MENVLTQKIVTSALDKRYQDAMKRLSTPMVAENAYVLTPQTYQPYSNAKRSNGILFFVIMAHLVAIYFLAQKELITPPNFSPVKPVLVSIIAPPAPEPVLVPVIEPPKPVVEPKPKLKKVVEKIKPIEVPTEMLVEATTEQVKEDSSTVVEQVAQEAPETKAPPAEPVIEEKIEPPKFGVAYLNNPKPAYPPLSKRVGEEGRVLLRVLVSENGEPTEVQLEKTSGSERLDRAAIEAVRNWRFIPARKGNQALSAYVLVPVKFSLNS
jgi:periplasmic protein TonB